MRESELAKPVMDWLANRGFTPYGEIGWGDSAIDIVGISAEAIEAVELKLYLTRHVIRQALRNQLTADRSWCAVGSKPRNPQDRIRHGIGLLVVTGGAVQVIIEAQTTPDVTNALHIRQLRGRCHHRQPFGNAGTPTMKGIGVAQSVYDAVDAFRAANPSAGWNEIFRQVPNHYAHKRSMQGAMRIVRNIRASKLAYQEAL